MAKCIKVTSGSEVNLDERVNDLNIALINSLNAFAPLQTKQITICRTVPWFTDEVKDLKKNIWHEGRPSGEHIKEKTPGQHLVRSKYRLKLQSAKKEILSNKVLGCGNDTRRLYALVNALTGVPNNINPLLECDNYDQLAQDFADHFMTKIRNICNSLDIFSKYNPPMGHTTKLTQFNGLTVDEVEEMVNNLQPKTCDSDPIPTKVFKKISPLIMEQIMDIIHILLTEGEFATSWKVATIKPLLKKLSLDPILKIYQPVSNLTFMSKLIEKCMLKQLNRHNEQYQLMPSYQSAYQQHHSSETSLLKLTNDI